MLNCILYGCLSSDKRRRGDFALINVRLFFLHHRFGFLNLEPVVKDIHQVDLIFCLRVLTGLRYTFSTFLLAHRSRLELSASAAATGLGANALGGSLDLDKRRNQHVCHIHIQHSLYGRFFALRVLS